MQNSNSMYSNNLSLLNSAKLKFAKQFAPIKESQIASYSSIDFDISIPKITSLLDLSIPDIGIDDTELFSNKIEMLESPDFLFDELDGCNFFEDFNNLPEVENFIIGFDGLKVEGKNYTIVKVAKQTTLFSDYDFEYKSEQDKFGKLKKRYSNIDDADAFDLFEIIFPALQPPLGKNFDNTISLFKPLYDYQVDGIKFLCSSKSALLGDEMGLGKSIQTIIAARVLFRQGRVLNAIIVCPKVVLTDWERKLSDWAPEMRVIKISGDKNQRNLLWNTKAHFYICTFDALKIDLESGHAIDLIDLLIIDEIQNIKSVSAERTKAVRKVKSKFKWALSATPLENSINDLITICETIKPDIFKHLKERSDSSIIQSYKPYFLRRKKVDALDLPPIVTDEVWLDLLPSQREKYDLAEQTGIVELKEIGEKLSIQHVLALITKLKQICNFDEDTKGSIKLDYLLSKLEGIKEQGDKALIFSQYPNATLKKIQPLLSKYNPFIYDGSLSDEKRTRLIDDFQNNDFSDILLLSLKAGNSGITLTRANYVYHFDLWWNPSISAQALGRAHRIGQQKTVFETLLLADNTIERRIYDILEEKKQKFKHIVDDLSDTDILAGTLSEKEIFGLFGIEKKVSIDTSDSNLSLDYNLLDPFEFEHFVSDLFSKMGYFSKVTKKSSDGGVDIIAKIVTSTGIDEIIIQCKHKQNISSTVGVDKVRELFGVLSSQRHLNKAILITNGRFTSGVYDFAKDKAIELIDGTKLRGLIEKYK
jgi:SNF2 family DNA or RNA helicase